MKRAIAVAGLAVVLSSCGSPTDHVTFQPPPGFTSTVSMGPFGQVWEGPNHNMMVLMVLPTQIDLEGSASTSGIKNVSVKSRSHTKICGDQDAVTMNLVGTPQGETDGKKDAPQDVEFLATHLNGKTYLVSYLRPIGAKPDASAETALRNVCPK